MSPSDKGVQRRQLLKALPVAGIGFLAGCESTDSGDGDSGTTSNGGGGNGGGGSNGDLGERVEPIILKYLSDQGDATEIYRGAAENMAAGMREHLGLEVTVEGVTTADHFGEAYYDARTYHFDNWFQGPRIPRIDPHDLMSNWTIMNAGNNGRPNPAQYANCEYTTLVQQGASATSDDERRSLVNQAQQVWSHDIGLIPYAPVTLYGAIRTDMIEPARTGKIGFSSANSWYLRKSGNKQNGKIVVSTTNPALSTTNFGGITDNRGQDIWSRQIHSPLVEYNENLEIVNTLAESIDIADGYTTITVTLRNDATFHDGEPVTAEDVRWTFQFISDYPELWEQSISPPWESIEVVDDRTVEFNLTEPFPPATTTHFPRWGILHSQRWIDGGAEDDPLNFELDPIIGSGPFQVETFRKQEILETTPYDDHVVSVNNDGVIWQAYADAQSQFQAFQAGTVHAIETIQAGLYNRVQNEMGNVAQGVAGEGWTTYQFWPQHSYGPTKFREFRAAAGKILDRRQIKEVLFQGSSAEMLYCTNMPDSHPWRPPNDMLYKFTDSLTPDVEGARQTLTDEGWGWDDDGRLHYPADANLEPLWPAEGTPQPEDFPCIDAEGNYVPAEER